MSESPFRRLVHRMRHALAPPPAVDMTDRQLLERFTASHDEAAFTALVDRHGPLVLGVCRRLLAAEADAEDAFQATFLVLVRRARAVAWHDGLGAWLYQVAYRVSLKARAARARRLATERAMDDLSAAAALPPPTADAELKHVIDEELNRLPERYRTPLVLCYLQGKTHDQAARELGWARGSMAKRIKRGQDLLRGRLVGRGVGLGAAGLAATAMSEATAAVPAGLAGATVRAAALFAAGEAAVSTNVSTLTQGVLRTMSMNRMKNAAVAGLCLLGLVGGGLGLFWRPGPTASADDLGPPPVFTLPAETPQVKADREATVRGNTEFALDLYKRLAKSKENAGKNLFLSPYSISTALAMTYAGARGETAEEMEKVLHFPVPAERLHPAFAGLVGRLQANKEDKGYQLAVANSLWGQKGYPWQKEFLTTTFTNYNAGLRTVDYLHDAEGARQTINAWVAEQTRDKIKDVVPKDALRSNTRLVLANAIYFKGDWLDKFDKKLTREAPFRGAASPEAKADMMLRVDDYRYFSDENFQALDLPYKGKELSMVLLLPKAVDGLADLESKLTVEQLTEATGKLRRQRVEVHLPKFKLTSEFVLNEQLSGLGMPSAFNSAKANFQGMNGGTEPLWINTVRHKAFVEVNEEGTEAAAATIADMAGGGLPPRPPVFNADHPFLFLIKDNRTDSVLFLGRLTEPTR